MTDYPEHEKIKALGGANQVVGSFIEWLDEQGYEIAVPYRDTGLYSPSYKTRDELIAAFFEIDADRLEAERRAMLEKLR